MTKQRCLGMVLLLAACGGTPAAQVEPATSANGAVQGFMAAVADSNFEKMASLWGSALGPASKTNQPPDWRRRIPVMQAYLRHDSFRVASDTPEADQSRRTLQVEIKRGTCTWMVPFVALKGREGSWLITQIDLAAAGNPARPCMGGPNDSVPQG